MRPAGSSDSPQAAIAGVAAATGASTLSEVSVCSPSRMDSAPKTVMNHATPTIVLSHVSSAAAQPYRTAGPPIFVGDYHDDKGSILPPSRVPRCFLADAIRALWASLRSPSR